MAVISWMHPVFFQLSVYGKEEVKAVSEAISYMKSHDDFLLLPQFLSAMDKLMATLTMEKRKAVFM